MTEVDEPSGLVVAFTYDADGNRISKVVGPIAVNTIISDVYALGHLAYETASQPPTVGTLTVAYTYDTHGTPTSVTLGTGTGAPRYYYVYDGQGNVVALTDSSGTIVASYSYDAFGNMTSSSENLPGSLYGWTNPYRYDGAQGVRYDTETGLYWMSVRAYDPTLGRFISHDPLGRLTVFGLDTEPYVYAGNNPVNYTAPSGMLISAGPGSGQTSVTPPSQSSTKTRMSTVPVKALHRAPVTSRMKKAGSGNSGSGLHSVTNKSGTNRPKIFPHVEVFGCLAIVLVTFDVNTLDVKGGAFCNTGAISQRMTYYLQTKDELTGTWDFPSHSFENKCNYCETLGPDVIWLYPDLGSIVRVFVVYEACVGFLWSDMCESATYRSPEYVFGNDQSIENPNPPA